MEDIRKPYGSWCLVAGAAEGLGEAWSAALAERGMNLIMADDREESLRALGDELERVHGIETRRLHMDLAGEGSVSLMMDAVRETSCRLMVYNAAFSRVKKFTANTPEEMDRYVDVNVRTPVQLVHAFAGLHADDPGLKKGIVLMASLAGLRGAGLLAPYGATKAFHIILAEALHHELKPLNFDAMACIAGATSTPAFLESHPQYTRFRPPIMTPRQVAERALGALGRKALYVPGFRNRLNVFLLTRILCRKASARMFHRSVAGMYPDA